MQETPWGSLGGHPESLSGGYAMVSSRGAHRAGSQWGAYVQRRGQRVYLHLGKLGGGVTGRKSR